MALEEVVRQYDRVIEGLDIAIGDHIERCETCPVGPEIDGVHGMCDVLDDLVVERDLVIRRRWIADNRRIS